MWWSLGVLLSPSDFQDKFGHILLWSLVYILQRQSKIFYQTQVTMFCFCLFFSRGCYFNGWLHDNGWIHWGRAGQNWADKRHPRAERIWAEIHVRSPPSQRLRVLITFKYISSSDTKKEHAAPQELYMSGINNRRSHVQYDKKIREENSIGI